MNFLVVHLLLEEKNIFKSLSLPLIYPRRCQEIFRMPLETFLALEKWLTEHTSLKESRKHFSVRQKIAMFLYIVGEGASNRAVQEKFLHSGDTVSHVFHEVLIP